MSTVAPQDIITIQPLSLDAFGVTNRPAAGHVLKFEVKDWTKMFEISLMSPLFKINQYDCYLGFKGNVSGTHKGVDASKVSVRLYFIAHMKHWSICIGGGMRLVLDDYTCGSEFDQAGVWLSCMKGSGFTFDVDPTAKKFVVLLNYQLLNTWINSKIINCDNPECEDGIIIPTFRLGCSHVFCDKHDCKKLATSPTCVVCNNVPKCICDQCALIKN